MPSKAFARNVAMGLLGFWGHAQTSWAQQPPQGSLSNDTCDGEPWIALHSRFEAGAIGGDFETGLRAHLQNRGFALCEGVISQNSQPQARVYLELVTEMAIRVRVQFSAGAKRPDVQQVLDLQTLPQDGRALTVATIVGELLRTPTAAAPLPVLAAPAKAKTAAVKAAPSEARGEVLSLMLGFAASAASEGSTQYGPDLRLQYRAGRWMDAGLRLGYRRARPAVAADGKVETNIALLGASIGLPLTESRAAVQGRVALFADAAFVRFAGRPSNSEAEGRSANLGALLTGVSASIACWLLPSWAGGIRLAGYLTPISARAADDDGRITAVAGVGADLSFFIAFRP